MADTEPQTVYDAEVAYLRQLAVDIYKTDTEIKRDKQQTLGKHACLLFIDYKVSVDTRRRKPIITVHFRHGAGYAETQSYMNAVRWLRDWLDPNNKH